eukprot:jgi/Mesen1/1796/ME000014S01198
MRFRGGALVLYFIGYAFTLASPGLADSSSAYILQEAATSVINSIAELNGCEKGDVSIGMVDTKDIGAGQGLLYSFVVELGGVRTEISLSEEVPAWEDVGSSLLPYGETLTPVDAAIGVWKPDSSERTLPGFELAGPLELWIQDAAQLKLSMPHEVDAGELKKVVLADGATVVVHGAQAVSLARPLQLPLPLTKNSDKLEGGVAVGLSSLASRLRAAARSQSLHDGRPLLSLRVVKPTALVAASPHALAGGGVSTMSTEEKSSSSSSSSHVPAAPRLKVKRLSQTAVELRSRQVAVPGWEAVGGSVEEEPSLVWPFSSVNVSDPRLVSMEQALLALLGAKAEKKGYFRVLGASVSPVSMVRLQFEAELNSSKVPDRIMFAEAAEHMIGTSLSPITRQRWEVIARAGPQGKLHPIRLRQVSPYGSTVSVSLNDLTANGTLIGEELPMMEPLSSLLLQGGFQ